MKISYKHFIKWLPYIIGIPLLLFIYFKFYQADLMNKKLIDKYYEDFNESFRGKILKIKFHKIE